MKWFKGLISPRINHIQIQKKILPKKQKNFLYDKAMRVCEKPLIAFTVTFIIFLTFGQSRLPGRDFLSASAIRLAPTKNNEETKIFLNQGGISPTFNGLPTISINENTLKPLSPTMAIKAKVLASIGESYLGQEDMKEEKEAFEYLVQAGDTITSLAEQFNISEETILWANGLSSKSKLEAGRVLTILPISGVMHLVGKGESLGYLSNLYKADADEIADFNDLSSENEIYTGDLLIIPGGKMPAKQSTPYYAPMASSYFICPILGSCRVSQGLHWYNAVDLSNGTCGEPVFSSAGGTVQRTGSGNITGKYVRIIHPNGVATYYGHLSSILSFAGQQVSQGQIIGYVGNTGYTVGPTGCHVHFEVRGAKNPFAK